MGENLPYMPLWVSDFLGSARVRELPGETQGLYLLALVLEWGHRGKGLPADDETLARSLSLSTESWAEHRAGILQFFDPGPDGRLHNETLKVWWKWANGRANARSRAGKIGAEARWQTDGNRIADANADANGKPDGKPMANDMAKPKQTRWQNDGISSSSSSSSSRDACITREADSETEPERSQNGTTEGPAELAEPECPTCLWPPDSSMVHFRLSSHPWNFGHLNVSEILDRGITAADVDAWETWAEVNGMPAASKGIRQFKNPTEIPKPRGKTKKTAVEIFREQQAFEADREQERRQTGNP